MDELKTVRREREMTQLWQAFQALDRGCCQLRFIPGEAGTGKSVLLEMFAGELEEKTENTLIASTFCCIRSEYSIPYQPFKELLKQLMQEVRDNEEIEKKGRSGREKLKEAFAFSARMLLEHAPDLIDNFIPVGTVLGAIGQHFLGNDEKPEKNNSPDESKIIEEYINTLRAVSGKYRLVLLLDDLQWIDKPSVNLLYQLSVVLKDCPVLIVGSYRSTDIDVADGEKHPMDKLINEVKISYGNVFLHLDNIDVWERRKFMDQLLDREANVYDAAFRQTLFERTGGNPLFVSEMVCLLKEEGVLEQNEVGIWTNHKIPDWQSYPVRIEGIIRERIGRLEESMVEVLSQASVQGYRFIVQVLSRTMGETERDLLMTLSRKLQKQYHLVNEGPCVRSTRGLVSEFNFSNYIFQQYLYQELSATQRMILHGDIAVILEELFRDNIGEVAGDIARHYELAGEPEKALKYIEITVDQMLAVSGFLEASVLLDKALGGFAGQMDEYIRLRFLVKQGLCYRSVKGWGSEDTGRLYLEAEELSRKLECDDYTEIILFGQWTICLVKLQLDRCLELAAGYRKIAVERNDLPMGLMALITSINTLFWRGELREADACLKEFEELYKKKDPAIPVQPAVETLYGMFNLLISFQLGDYERTAEAKKQLIAKISATKDRFCQSIAYQALTWQEYLAGNREQSGKYAETLLELAKAGGYPFYISVGYLFYGAFVAMTNAEEGIGLIREGYKILQGNTELDVVSMHSVYGLLLNTVYLENGRFDELKDSLPKIIEKSIQVKEVCYLSELYLLEGRSYQATGDRAKADIAFEEACQIAREIGAEHAREMIRKFRM